MFARMSLRWKLLLLSIFMITVPLSLQGVVTYKEFSSSTERRATENTMQITEQINRNLDRTLAEMQRLSLAPLYDPNVLAILNKYGGADSDAAIPTIEEREKMFLYISGAAYGLQEVKGIQIIAGNGFIFTNVDSTLMRFADSDALDWSGKVREADGAWTLIPPHHLHHYIPGDPNEYFSVARMLREPGSNRQLGMIVIDLKLDVFRTILANYRFEENGNLFVVNGANDLFFEKTSGDTEPSLIGDLRAVSASFGSGVYERAPNGKRYITVVDNSAYSGLKVIAYIPESVLLKETKQLQNFTIAIAILFVAAAGVIAIFFAYRISQPLVKLKQKMLLVETGNFKQSVPVETQDEIGQLGRGFNRMSEEINRLVNEVYAVELREKEAELANLQSQINPHFIYNTLESINMMALQKDNYEVSDMVTALGGMLRYAVTQNARTVALEEELASVGAYLKIQQLRYGDRLRVAFDAEPGTEGLHVPKLLLQPLVENAIFHGIGDREEGGEIWISASRFEDELLICVRDDGVGMDETQIERLRQSMLSPEPPGPRRRGLALRNIAHRLRLIFGPTAELHMDGSPGGGMAFTITIPAIERSQGDDQTIAG
ncbi:cache domain-containing sensor histidine kinase [Cohnella thailandensis]|uniref:histidine kinase n=1 Tax=Cohnella thailandensis TaxID=557557 RepID=A0A841SYW0_9BACL|nr:sensor histidine kinase [Cohnella thailandensis]MBB6637393.1 sensor histidine kinase [Cohnella thailandensis]MBP1976722.1 two-component system sensor histidine kinase YesM [Cohnella thailandensis]